MAIHAGTPETRTNHSTLLAPTGFVLSMAIPAAIVLAGILTLGWGAISWAGAIIWGIVATIAFTVFSVTGKKTGMTRMDLLDLLGSVVARPGSDRSRRIGNLVHHMNGALLGIAWAYGAGLLGVAAAWTSGLAWGVILWVLAMLMMSTMGAVHPAIRRGEQEDPGPAAVNFGSTTPVGSLMAHLVYGLVLGLAYQTWPLG